MSEFAHEIRREQVGWRRRALKNQRPGYQSGTLYNHVLPRSEWELNLWRGIRSNSGNSLPEYIAKSRIKPHIDIHNLCSSWVLCANLYFPFRSPSGRELIAGFMSEVLGVNVLSCEAIELEYEPPEFHLKPASLLGEDQGGRGTGQTSPDVAFKITTDRGLGIVLVESKYTEHWFYECSGHKRSTNGREPNPDRDRCKHFVKVIEQPDTQCHLNTWGRRYWYYLGAMVNPDLAKQILICPAATGAYQLLRQQSFAVALSKTDQIDISVSAVAYDSRNENLFSVIHKTEGIVDARDVWSKLFQDQIKFAYFTHQSWVNWVRQYNANGNWNDWLEYVTDRYGY